MRAARAVLATARARPRAASERVSTPGGLYIHNSYDSPSLSAEPVGYVRGGTWGSVCGCTHWHARLHADIGNGAEYQHAPEPAAFDGAEAQNGRAPSLRGCPGPLSRRRLYHDEHHRAPRRTNAGPRGYRYRWGRV